MPGEVSVRKIAVALMLLVSFAAMWAQEVVVDLPAEPFRVENVSASSDLTLADAALNNDFPSFIRLYQRDPRPEYAELHRLWNWAMNDRFGAFYGVETYSRLKTAYAGYAAWVEQYRIVDSNGNVFYPTAETRRFLVSAAVRGLVADVTPIRPALVAQPEAARAAIPESVPVAVVRPAPATLLAEPVVAPTVTVSKVAAPAAAANLVATPPARTAKVLSPQQPATPVPASPRNTESRSGGLGRGIFLIIAGLLGAGTVSLMLKTSPDEREVRPS